MVAAKTRPEIAATARARTGKKVARGGLGRRAATLAVVIALRQWVQRNRRNKWLFPLLLLILLLLVVVLAFHSWSDVADTGSGVVCVLLGFLITVVLLLLPPQLVARVGHTLARAPPRASLPRLLLPTPIPASAPLPLRL